MMAFNLQLSRIVSIRSRGQKRVDCARRSLRAPEAARSRNGIALLAAKPGVVVTPEIVNALRDEAP